MKRTLAIALGAVLAGTIVFPPTRQALAQAINEAIGKPGNPVPNQVMHIGSAGFNGASYVPRFCDKVLQVNTTIAAAAATVQLVAAAASQNIYVCDYQLALSTATAATAITWVEGTGAACATAQTTVLNPLITTPTSAPTTPNVTFGPVNNAVPFTIAAGDALCLKQASTTNATTVTGMLHYTQN